MPYDPSSMYRWRKLTPEQKAEVLADRLQHGRPFHSIPHIISDTSGYYMVTAACFEHISIIGYSPERMRQFERDLVDDLTRTCRQIFSWTVLPNHYHVLVDTQNIHASLSSLGKRWVVKRPCKSGNHILFMTTARTGISPTCDCWSTGIRR